MYWSSADFSGGFRLKGKSRKTFDTIISTKSVFFKFKFWMVWGVDCSPASPLECAPGFYNFFQKFTKNPHTKTALKKKQKFMT
jgi:hypothetical protein